MLENTPELRAFDARNGDHVYDEAARSCYYENGAELQINGLWIEPGNGLHTIPGQPWINKARYAELKLRRATAAFDAKRAVLLAPHVAGNPYYVADPDAALAELGSLRDAVRRWEAAVAAAQADRDERDPARRAELAEAARRAEAAQRVAAFQDRVKAMEV